MEKIYTKPKFNTENKLPSQQTKNFILNYSKAFQVIQCKNLVVEVLIN